MLSEVNTKDNPIFVSFLLYFVPTPPPLILTTPFNNLSKSLKPPVYYEPESIPYYTILYYTILYYTILYYTILYYTILYCTILCYAMLYYAMLYYISICQRGEKHSTRALIGSSGASYPVLAYTKPVNSVFRAL